MTNTEKKSMKEFVLHMADLLESSTDIIIVLNKDGNIERSSRGFKDYMDFLEKQDSVLNLKDVIENSKLYKSAVTGKCMSQRITYLGKHNMILNCIPIFNKDGAYGALGILSYENKESVQKNIKRGKKITGGRGVPRGNGSSNVAVYNIDSIVGETDEITQLKKMITMAAKGSSNVLITGESGTGKENFAQALHTESDRKDGPFVSVNCAAVPGELLEAEFFGYEEGAFTGARRGGKIGVFQAANGGTLFLDEIGDLPLNMQAKLLRVLQERAVQRVGGIEKESVDIRIVAASNRNLAELSERGEFRDDLYFRLDVIHIHVPPLRERMEDIPHLCRYILKKYEGFDGKEIEGISHNALEAMMKYEWPGNVRELENIIERAVNFLDEETIIDTCHLPKKITGKTHYLNDKSLKEYMEEAERNIIFETIVGNNCNKTDAARELKISRACLYKKMRKYNIEKY